MRIFLLILLISSTTSAQNFSVRFAGTNAPAGFPEFWPVESYSIGTNQNVTPPWVLMTQEQIAACKATNRVAITAYYSNQTYQAYVVGKADEVATNKAGAKVLLDIANSDTSRAMRAFAELTLEQINTLRTRDGLPAITWEQFLNAMKAKIDAQQE